MQYILSDTNKVGSEGQKKSLSSCLIARESNPSSAFHPWWGTADGESKDPPPPPLLVGAQGYQKFLFSKSVVGQSIAVHAASADGASDYLVSGRPDMTFAVDWAPKKIVSVYLPSFYSRFIRPRCSPNFSSPTLNQGTVA